MIQELRASISTDSGEVIAPILSIPEDALDPSRSRVTIGDDATSAAYVAAGDAHCPFEIVIGHGSGEGRLAFYLGTGAEVFGWEDSFALDAGYRATVVTMLASFVRSSVEIRCVSSHSGDVRVIYAVDEWTRRGMPPAIKTNSLAWPWTPLATRVQHKSPWLR